MLSDPATLMGRFLRALVRKDREERERLQAELVRTEWDGAHGVLDAAFLEAVQLKFEPNTKPRELTKFAYRMVRHFRAKKLSVSDADKILQWGYGRQISVDDIPSMEAQSIKMLFLVAVAQDRRLTDDQINELLIRAERYAYKVGYRPTLANPG